MIIHTERDSDKIIISSEEWKMIINKLSQIEEVKVEQKHKHHGRGIFKEYANPELIPQEKEAWEDAAERKHENR